MKNSFLITWMVCATFITLAWIFTSATYDSQAECMPQLPIGVTIEVYPDRDSTNVYQVHYELAHPVFETYEEMVEAMPKIIKDHNTARAEEK